MGEFTPITSQEEFERRLQERLTQKERSVKKQFEGYTSPDDLEKIKNDYNIQITSLNDKLGQAEQNASQKYEGYTSPDDFKKMKDEYDSKIAKYETDSVKTRIAIESGLPLNFIDRIKGTTEEEIREDVKALSGFAQNFRQPPLAGYEKDYSQSGASDAAYRKLAKNLGKKEQ